MKLRLHQRLAAAAGLCLSSLGLAQQPASMPQEVAQASVSNDQKMADAIAKNLAASPLRGYQVEIVCLNGVVEVSGTALNSQQHAAIVGVCRSSGMQVRDRIAVMNGIQQVNGYGKAPAGPAAGGAPALPPGAIPAGPGGPGGGYGGPGGYGMGADPAPLNSNGAGLHPPGMPPYSWPTYAPYNNYSRVAYPDAYPHDAFPYIGPMYPFPKVPLGFRAIKLEWEDAHWFYGRNSAPRDWWKVRYW